MADTELDSLVEKIIWVKNRWVAWEFESNTVANLLLQIRIWVKYCCKFEAISQFHIDLADILHFRKLRYNSQNLKQFRNFTWTCGNWEKVRKAAKICVFRNRTPKNLAKTLRKACENLNFRNILQNISNFRKFHFFFSRNSRVLLERQYYLSLCHLLLHGPKSGAHKMNVAQFPSTIFSTCITVLFLYRDSGTALSKGGFC